MIIVQRLHKTGGTFDIDVGAYLVQSSNSPSYERIEDIYIDRCNGTNDFGRWVSNNGHLFSILLQFETPRFKELQLQSIALVPLAIGIVWDNGYGCHC